MHRATVCLPDKPSRAPALTTAGRVTKPDYRMGAIGSVHAGMVAIVNARGGRELFVVAADGRVVHFYPDASSDTGFRAAETGLSGAAIAAGLDARGRIVLFAARGLQLAWVREQGMPGARWSAPAVCAVPMPPAAVAIDAVVASSVGGELLVAALVSARSADGLLTHMSWCAWPDDDDAPRMQRSPFATNARHCAWTGAGMEDAAFTAIDHGILDYRVAFDRARRREIAPFTAIDVAGALDANGHDQVVAILQDGRVYRLAAEGANRCAWRPLAFDVACMQVGLGRDAAGALHVFALGVDHRLWRLAPAPGSPDGYAEPSLLLTNVLRFGVAKGQGDLDLFVVVGHGTGAGRPEQGECGSGYGEDGGDGDGQAAGGDSLESIRRRIRCKTREATALAQVAWLAWFHPGRMLEPLGYIVPA
jgi:hypothetical protein